MEKSVNLNKTVTDNSYNIANSTKTYEIGC